MARGLAQHGGPSGWLEESDRAGCDFVRDGRSMPPALHEGPLPDLLYYYYYKCTQNNVMSYCRSRKEAMAWYSSRPMPSLWVQQKNCRESKNFFLSLQRLKTMSKLRRRFSLLLLISHSLFLESLSASPAPHYVDKTILGYRPLTRSIAPLLLAYPKLLLGLVEIVFKTFAKYEITTSRLVRGYLVLCYRNFLSTDSQSWKIA